MPTSRFSPPPHGGHRILLGLAVVAIGVLALLDNLRLFDTALLRTFWPMGLVLWGLGRLAWPSHAGSGLLGVALIGVGLALTAQNLGYMHFRWRDWWPVFIILAGLSILLRGIFPAATAVPGSSPAATLQHGDLVDINATFGAVSQQLDSRGFQGGRITSTFGGVKLDLTQAAITGTQAVLQIDASFSGIELCVPREWQVVIEIASTLGGVEDKTAAPAMASPRLVLRGAITCGGIEVRH